VAYPFEQIEQRWQAYWKEQATFSAQYPSDKPNYYVLDMFPYPSGAGLHVGHPLGYIASDIYTRYKRLQGFNVLHPMGYDAFGLPAEQYAIQTGQHPAKTTAVNMKRYREQLDAIGLSFDWSRQVVTSDPAYYKHTQATFIDLFEHWYDRSQNKARPIAELVAHFTEQGTDQLDAATENVRQFSGQDWQGLSEQQQADILQDYRLAYQADLMVNWCPALGTVLANDEVKEGLSVRGGHPVEQKSMRQWCLRITAYAQRLLDGLDSLDWPLPLKEMQRNWIGRSTGAQIQFAIHGLAEEGFDIFTTRPDTLYGVSFMVLAPESEWVERLTTAEQKQIVETYLEKTKNRSERERMTETKKVSGVFTGSYAIHPLTNEKIPIWIGDYVLGGYGTGAIMAVPAHDSRDHAFAKHFDLPIIPVVDAGNDHDFSESSFDAKDGKMINSELIDGLDVSVAIGKITDHLVENKIGYAKVNYKLRDATFSRQRYWGEPIPIYYQDGIAKAVDKKDLPLELPEVDQYLPTEDGDPPLGRAKDWSYQGHPLEMSTMPGFAGSSAYFLRYMDPHNNEALIDKAVVDYWKQVDFYVGGSEHATGHLLYSRFWNMFLFDQGKISHSEPFKKLINQGMIQGRSNFVYRLKGTQTYISKDLINDQEVTPIHVDISLVSNDYLDTEKFKAWRPEFAQADFQLKDGKYLCGVATEKMSKSMFNVVNPDDIIAQYGADAFRLYEMFLGPVEQSKPWNTQGIEGIGRFLNKFYRLFYNDEGALDIEEGGPSKEELKVLYTLVKKIQTDLENFSLNTAVSAFMICLNDLNKLKCRKRSVLEPFVICLSPFAPHLAEQIWSDLGQQESISFAQFPDYDESYLVEDTHKYPVSVNGKLKFVLEISLDADKAEIEKQVLASEEGQKLLADKSIKKTIIVPKKIVNFVI
jgi:leucyl-tRNA synthetase